MAAESVNPSSTWADSEILSAPMEVCWQWSYEISQPKLLNLYKKAKQSQWDADQELDWTIEVDPAQPIISEQTHALLRLPFFKTLSKKQRETFAAHSTAQLLSQFLHGEQGALMTASALTHAVPDYDAKLYCATQAMDEARHVEVYDRYIRKIALSYPISPWLKELIDATLTADHYAKILIGMNMVVEGLALGAFHNMRRDTSCPLLRSLTDYVLRDESRHVAFGNLYLREVIANMHDDEREDVADFAFIAVRDMAEAMGGPDGTRPRKADPGFLKVLERSEIDLGDFLRGLQESGMAGINFRTPPGHIHSFRDLMMPALVRVGAITKRSRELFAQAEIPVWEDTHVLTSLENADMAGAEA